MLLHVHQTVDVPKDVKITVTHRNVVVSGPRGSLTRSFDHIPLEMRVIDQGRKVSVAAWNCDRSHSSCVRTVCTHIHNLIVGVTKGYQYKMRMVHSHFPITTEIGPNGDWFEMYLFIGQKAKRLVHMPEGVKISYNTEDPTEVILVGNDLESVSLTAAKIHQSLKARDKDLRKFLDGIYVSEKGPIPDPEE